MTTNGSSGDRTDSNHSWGHILAAFGVPPARATMPSIPPPSVPPPRQAMPSVPPAPPSVPPPRATFHSIAPTAFDVEPEAAPLPPSGELAVDFRPREGKGMVLFGGLAALALAFAGVWSQAGGGPLAAAAGAEAASGLDLRPVHVRPGHDTAIPAAPAGHGVPEIGEPGASAVANAPARELRQISPEELSARIDRNDPAVRYNAPEAYRTRTRVVQSIPKTHGTDQSIVPATLQPQAADKGVEWNDAPRMGYETTVVGEFAGKL